MKHIKIEDISIFQLINMVSWKRLNSRIANEVKVDLDRLEVEMYLKLLVIYFNFTTIKELNTFFKSISNDNMTALTYRRFAAPFYIIKKREYKTLEKFYNYVINNNLEKYFKVEEDLFTRDYSRADTTNIAYGLT